jgi:hypothetical protein
MKLERPTSGQFAFGGAWENAWSFACSALPDDDAVRACVAGRSEVAFEVFFGESFFGVRFNGTPDEVAAFASTCVQALRSTTPRTSFVVELSRLLNLDGFGRQLGFAEIGAVNAWRSVGAFRIERPRDAARDFDRLWQDLQRSAVSRDLCHRKALELAYAAPLPHWFGIPLCDGSPPFAISRHRLQAALDALVHR